MPSICLLVDWFLPAYKAGGPIQSLANLVAQQEEGVTYNIICSNKDLDRTTINVTPNQWLPYNRWTKVWYASGGVNRRLLREKVDVLFINGIYSWNYTLKPILFSNAARKIVSVRGMLHPGALSQKSSKKKLYLWIWKLLGLHKKVAFHASTNEEKTYIQTAFGKTVNVYVAANFPRVFQKQNIPEKRQGELKIVSIALISPMKNILLVLQALRTITAVIHYHIYGPVKDEMYWQQCKQVINSLPANIKVTYHGDLHPTKVEDALQKSHVFILPSKSENFGHAICEAMTAGKPVITSHYTPWRNLQMAKAGCNVSIKNEQELTKAIGLFAAMTETELRLWSDGANAYAQATINTEEIRAQYRNMFGVANKNKYPIDLIEQVG